MTTTRPQSPPSPDAHLFAPLRLRDVELRHRIVVSPMCQYSSEDGLANDWHLAHLASRAVGGAALVFTEAAAVEARGRISPQDLGIYSDAHIEPLERIVRFIDAQGAVAGVQLAHAGRKASTRRPWEQTGKNAAVPESEGGWVPVAPSAIAFDDTFPTPTALSRSEIDDVIASFAAGARRARRAGFRVVELHAAHGYLLHQMLSPKSNHRDDEHGGSFENRTRLVLDVVKAIRTEWPDTLPLFVRLSATDWVEGSWSADDTVQLVGRLAPLGVDLIDCSSGGILPHIRIPVGTGYQTPFAARVKHETGVLSGAVGLITSPAQADHIIRTGQADLVLLARQLLRDPYWPLHAAEELKQKAPWAPQYARAAE